MKKSVSLPKRFEEEQTLFAKGFELGVYAFDELVQEYSAEEVWKHLKDYIDKDLRPWVRKGGDLDSPKWIKDNRVYNETDKIIIHSTPKA